jgi:hypothetical protein
MYALGPEVSQQHGELGATAVTPALYGAGGNAEHRRGLVDRQSLQVDEHDRQALLVREPRERVGHLDDGLALGDLIARFGDGRERVGVVRHDRPDPAPSHPVQTRVDDDPVQPRAELRVAAEPGSLPVGRDERVLYGVFGLTCIAEGAQRDGPGPIAVPGDENAERRGVAISVPA